MKICLDAGHYGKYNRSNVVSEYYESEMNWKLAELLEKELEGRGFEVVRTRAEQGKDLGLVARGKKAAGCDLFLSIHSNAAEAEYVDYPLVITMLDGKGDELGLEIAKKIRELMGTAQAGKITHKEGSDGEWYSVLWGAASVGVMGMILEHSFHTNTKAAKWLLEEENLKAMAKAEAEIIAAYFGMGKPKEDATEDSTYYDVCLGPHTKEEAEAVAKKLTADGYYGVSIAQRGPDPEPVPETPAEWIPVEGDTVYFHGDKQYLSSDSDTARGAVPGLARITVTAEGNKHPYHLQRTGGTGPWGWVDAGTFTKA